MGNSSSRPGCDLPPDGEKKQFVREKFASISHRYDLLNSLLSLQIDRYWRWRTTRQLRANPAGWVLDLCAGTLPLSLELTRQARERRVLAVDFCEDMLRAGIRSLPLGDDRPARIVPVCGDGEQIPARDNTFQGCTVAFGVRNLANTARGLAEMHRVLRPGAKLLILEFSRPTNPLVKPVYSFYLHRILPVVAGLISGDREAYQYLASSIAAFYEPAHLMSMIREAGFSGVKRIPLTFGIASIYVGVKP
ncbi:MAG: ubiquinone/menaquinone biosynthesis methyltransferase [Desulfobulbus sp.]|jgi:demethylmenaquinone methyltransferase/2-methoxy-6-polyprenyl-1,4-benzoquinol methylase